MRKFRDSTLFIILEVLCIGWTVVTIIFITLQAFGLAPAELSFVSKDAIRPLVHLYPGNNIRLKPEFIKSLPEGDIEDIMWTLSGAGKTSDIPGLEPVVTLPPDGGLYRVQVRARIRNSDDRKGTTSIYIVQTKPQKVTASEDTKVKIDDLPKDIKQIAVYEGNGESRLAQIETVNGQTYLHLNKGDQVPAFNGKVFYAPASSIGIKAEVKELKAFTVPADLKLKEDVER